ncbi:MAG: hemolysin family protein [candidate division Zixibacteria bacterium]|nr:hemolysin family protein [candidate division Zixibacteria bacterium]
MDSNLLLELLAIFVLVLANGFFALAEFSIVASRSSRLRQKVIEKKVGARTAEQLRKKPEQFLASIQVGITLAAAMLGVFSGATIVEKLKFLLRASEIPLLVLYARIISMAAVVLAITVLSVVLGELVPKFVALSYPERFARYSAGPINVFVRLTAPFSRMLSGTASLIVRLLGITRTTATDAVTEDEINQMIVDGRHRGVFDDTEEEFVRSVFEFSEGTVRRAMRGRTDIVALERFASSEDIMKAILENGYSRYPVYEKTIDNVVGVIYIKDFIDKQTDLSRISLAGLIREPTFVPDSLPLARLLRDFQKGKNHLAIVLDEFGGTAGMITLEDVLEELVGEIQDEYDAEAAPIVKQSDTVAYADGDVWPGEVNELLHTSLPDEKNDTLAGLFMERAGHLPERNESILIDDVRLTVLAKDENRIIRVKLENTKPHIEDRD